MPKRDLAERSKPRNPRGRPAVHVDGAARQAAYRERLADEAAMGAAARALIAKPTPAFVKLMIDRLLAASPDPDVARRELLDQLAAGAGATT